MKGDEYWVDVKISNYDTKITKKELIKILEGYDDDCTISVMGSKPHKTEFLRSIVLVKYWGNEKISFNETKQLKLIGFHSNDEEGIRFHKEER